MAVTLTAWLKSHGQGALAHLSRQSGIQYSQLCAYTKGRTVPGARNALAICAATGGAVTVEELLTELLELQQNEVA